MIGDSEDLVPKQNDGSQLDTDFEVKAANDGEAARLFDLAVGRLLDVNNWHRLCGPLSAVFMLTDSEGRPVNGPARTGNHFKIDVPGPGPVAGDGFDWVQIEAMDDNRNSGSGEESVTLRVRPVPSPLNDNPDTAHFFSPEATSSFRVVRIGSLVRAEVHGRNEKPNTQTETPVDKIRNAVIGSGARAGISRPQWNSLVKGLLDTGGENQTL